jgi:hypothetical protein
MTHRAAYILSGIVMTLGLFCGGCATGPQYLYTGQKDSASIALGPAPVAAVAQAPMTWSGFWSRFIPKFGRSSAPMEAGVSIRRIDGLYLGGSVFDFSPKPYIDKAGKISIPPGTHTLVLMLGYSDSESIYNDGGTTVTTTNINASDPVDVVFAANHVYRFEASLSGSTFEVTLWDETGGVATRSTTGNWVFAGSESTSSDFTPDYNADKKN